MRETEEYRPRQETEPSPPVTGLPAALHDHPRYHVLKRLGEGGMGVVYQAQHKLMDRLVALKVIRSDLTARPGLVERFRREVLATAKLTHPNIVTAYDAEQAGDTFFLVTEFVEGTDLAQHLNEKGQLSLGEACSYVRQATGALQHAHEQQMIHRDLKPHNLMRTAAGQIKVLDFGLARVADATAEDGTGVGTILGTPDYMAPEQGRDSRAVDIRADIYSLGCTFYQLLSGRVPFPGGALLDKLRRHSEEPPTPLAELRAGIPPDLVAVVAKMMAKDPGERYQTPAEVVASLEPWCQPQPQTVDLAKPPRVSGSRKRGSIVVAIAAVLTLALALVGALIAVQAWRGPESPGPGGAGEVPPSADSPPSSGGERTDVAPDLSKLTPLIDDAFSDPKKRVFDEHRSSLETALFQDGLYVLSMLPSKRTDSGRSLFFHPAKSFHENLACQVTARVTGPAKYGWAVYISNTPSRIIAILMHRDGSVEVRSAPWTSGFTMSSVGPIRVASARLAEEFNTILAILRQGQVLEIYVNGLPLGPPLRLSQPLGPATPGIGFWRMRVPHAPEARAEFRRFTVWELPDASRPSPGPKHDD